MKNLFTTLLTLLIVQLTFAENYFINISKVNTERPEAIKTALQVLIKQTLITEGEKVVTTKKDSDYQLDLSYLKIDETTLLVLSMDGKSDSVMNKIKVSDSSELDIAISRIVRATINSDNTKDSMQLGQLTTAELYANKLRLPTRESILVGFGPGISSNFNGKTGISYLVGYKWSLDLQFDLQALLEVNSIGGKENISSGGLAMGGRYFFTTAKHAPFVSSVFGYGSSEISNHAPGGDTKSSGIFYGLGLGYEFYRTSDVNFSTEVAYRYFTNTTEFASPHSTQFRVIMAF